MLRTRWIELIHRAATGTKRNRTLLTPVGLAIFGGLASSFVVAAMVVDGLLDLPPLLPARAVLPSSIPTMTLGLAVTAWSAFHFLKVKGTPVPFNPPPQLVTTGPYRCCRNPMLTGVFLLLLGVGLFVNSPSLAALFLPLFVLANVWELKAIEEPELLRRLGAEYATYRKRTPMFVPRLGGAFARKKHPPEPEA